MYAFSFLKYLQEWKRASCTILWYPEWQDEPWAALTVSALEVLINQWARVVSLKTSCSSIVSQLRKEDFKPESSLGTFPKKRDFNETIQQK
jgi:hypothetical protein